MTGSGSTRRSFLKGCCLLGLQLVAIPGVEGTLKAQADLFPVDRAYPLVQDRAGRAVHLYAELERSEALKRQGAQLPVPVPEGRGGERRLHRL